jgi:bifunctional non-homologous end joining protein LigD
LNTAVTYEQTKPFAHELARLLERQHRDLVVSEMKKVLRTGKIFVDWSQNDDYKTTVCVYSLRAKDRPTVSTPVTWEEVEQCLKKEDPNLLVFTSDEVLKRVDNFGDLFEPVLTLKQKLPKIDELSALDGVPVAKTAPLKRTASAKERAKVMGKKTPKKRKTG